MHYCISLGKITLFTGAELRRVVYLYNQAAVLFIFRKYKRFEYNYCSGKKEKLVFLPPVRKAGFLWDGIFFFQRSSVKA